MDTYSIGTSSARSVKLYTYLIFWLNLELWRKAENVNLNVTQENLYYSNDLKHYNYLMKGFVIASRVRINQEGWTIIRDFKFFLNLYKKNEMSYYKLKSHHKYIYAVSTCFECCDHSDSPPINLLVTLSEPANRWHLFPWGRPIQIHYHIVLSNQKLQCANDIPATGKSH